MELFRTGGEMPDTNYIFMVSCHQGLFLELISYNTILRESQGKSIDIKEMSLFLSCIPSGLLENIFRSNKT